MKPSEQGHEVRAWQVARVLLEWHSYPPGQAGELPPHAHDEYQICLSLDFPGEYRYRGASHPVPQGAISLIHPGEVHSARDPFDRLAPATYRLLYVPAELLGDLAAEVTGMHGEVLPFFRDPVVLDDALAGDLRRVHAASEAGASRLELDDRLLGLLTRLIVRHATVSPGRATTFVGSRAVVRARDLLHADAAGDISLDELARRVGLSPFHLAHAFRVEVGMPPHAYQLAVRVARAKTLLAQGSPPAAVAAETGFVDQAHLTRHFRRLVGTTPGRYVGTRKNVQDSVA